MNTETGLPELPEGFFWRVEAQSVSIYLMLPPGEWGGDADDFTYFSSTSDKESRVRTVKTPWWRRDRTVTEWRRTNRAQCIKTARTKAVLDDDGKPRTFPSLYGTDRVLREKITAQDVIPLAEKALASWEADKELQVLVGDYPPKSLNGADS